MTWYARRAFLVNAALTEPGWGCVRQISDRHIGRVLMSRKYGFPRGFYRIDSAEYAMIATSARSWQKAQTSRLPK